MLYRIVHETPYVEGLDPALEPLVSAALAKEPTARPSAQGLLADLLGDETLVGSPDQARTRAVQLVHETWAVTTSGRVIERTQSRRRSRLVAMGAAALLLGAGGAATYWQANNPDPRKDDAAAVSATSPSPTPRETAEPELPDARDANISQLLRTGATKEKVLYGEMNGRAPEEIAIASAEHQGANFAQKYVDVFSWNGSRWKRVFDATRYTPPGADGPLLPFGGTDFVGARDLVLMDLVDFFDDETPELTLSVQTYGATSGPVQTWVLTQVGKRFRTDFYDETVRGGSVERIGDRLRVVTGEYGPSDPMCCPSFMLTKYIAGRDGEIRVVSSKSKPTEYYTPPLGESDLTLTGLGPIRVGMSLSEASESSKRELFITDSFHGGSCAYAEADGGPAGLRFMLLDGRIARVEVHEGSITTASGIGIGSSEQEVLSTYAGQIDVEPHPYEGSAGWNYLRYVPQDAADRQFSLIFETDGSRVLSFRSGEAEAVSYIEGCV